MVTVDHVLIDDLRMTQSHPEDEAFFGRLEPKLRSPRLAVWWWVRSTLAAQFDAHASALRIDRTCGRCGRAHGRPRLAANGGPAFSLSHTDHCAVLASTGTGRIGVDAEPRSPKVPVRRALAAAELRWLAHQGEATELPTRLWVRKEAVLKLSGLGLATDPREVAVHDLSHPVAAACDDGRVRNCNVSDLDFLCGCVGAVATEAQPDGPA